MLIEGFDSRLIDVGYLIRGDQVNLISVEQRSAPGDLFSRPPLVLHVEINTSTGNVQLFVINNHFLSMSGGEEATEPRRLAQAEWNISLVEEILVENPDALVAIVGDLNSLFLSSPIQAFRDGGLTPVFDTLPVEDRYSYIYQGESQVLDYIIITSSLLDILQRVEVLHINADFPPQAPDDASAVGRVRPRPGDCSVFAINFRSDMKHIIVLIGQRFIILLVAFGLLNPGPVLINAGIDFAPSIRNSNPIRDPASDDLITPETSDASHDNEVNWDGLEHDSRDTSYRTPTGPVVTGTSVTLRLRAASGDLTAARVRIFNDRQNTLSLLDMSLVADDGTHEWWQITLQPSSLPTVYWYRFIAIDGSDSDYYADDDELLGGLGIPTDEEVDNNWQLTIYDPAFQTPDWVQNAIIYQIFPDRFRDGDTRNDVATGSFYYGENSTIYRSNTSQWNQVICDPLDEDEDACPGVYGENFYGGDLQGVIAKLDYLDQLGVSAIYFNPIFRSPSNHGYDTNNYQIIDDSFGDITLFTTLVSQAEARGMAVILDGVFNHTSTDSVYFDLYQRYGGDGACESLSSYYRNWYFFYDVAPGTGPCISSDGVENGADYLSWLGIDSLPVLNSSNDRVQEQFWAPGTVPIGPLWVTNGRAEGWRLDVGGNIDPGLLVDPSNMYWEGFRTAILATNPQAYIIGEEWGNASSWTLGNEWDASTNYQFSNAVLGFWRSEPFVDNDHNADSAAGYNRAIITIATQ